MASTSEAGAAVETAAAPKQKRKGNYRGRPRTPEDHKEVLKRVREFLDNPTSHEKLANVVTVLINHEIKARLQGR
ncbi:hypothetical protein [Achromobacter insolitus]|uniref:hypothetical protein n=1 Tax=Achromobacter insolitus TaxID=217204 RepID=UPI00366FF023